jgi:hypothetical protein
VVRSPIAIRRDRIQRRDRSGTEPTSNRTDVEPNRTEPNATDPRRRCLPFARATDASFIRIIRAFSHAHASTRTAGPTRTHRFASDGRVVCYNTIDDTCRVVIGEMCDSRRDATG